MVEDSKNCVGIQNKTNICEIICTVKETARLNVKTSDKNDRVKFDRMSIVLEIQLSVVFNNNGFE